MVTRIVCCQYLVTSRLIENKSFVCRAVDWLSVEVPLIRVGTLLTRESVAEMYRGFPVDLLILLVGVTHLFGIAASNGTIERLVGAAAARVRGRRALIPWIVFAIAAVPTMAGAPQTTRERLLLLGVFVVGLAAGLVNWYLMDPGFFGI